MLSIQQLIKALRKLQSGSNTAALDLGKYLKNTSSSTTSSSSSSITAKTSAGSTTAMQSIVTSLLSQQESQNSTKVGEVQTPKQQTQQEHEFENEIEITNVSSQNISQSAHSGTLSQILNSNGNAATQSNCNSTPTKLHFSSKSQPQKQQNKQQQQIQQEFAYCRNQQIQNFYQQQLLYIHTQQTSNPQSKQQKTQFSMSSLAAVVEPLAHKQHEETASAINGGNDSTENSNGTNCHDDKETQGAAPSEKSCLNTGFAEIVQFMELIGNLKHTKRTGWVLRDVSDCESISGHMYRMSMMTFLLDGTEGLNQIRCMELALVHDLAESLVGDITPFCGVSKTDKRAMEFKAMDDICKLIEPRGKRIMELFEEYEHGQSAESKFVKDLDRLDMIMQAFEYEKRDNCLLKHQEFFDSTEGKFNHPFVKKLVDEICAQRSDLAKLKGATPPPSIQVPDMGDKNHQTSTPNGHPKQHTSSNSS